MSAFSGVSDKNYENPQNGLHAGRDSNVVPPECKSNTLPPEPARLVNCCDGYCLDCFFLILQAKTQLARAWFAGSCFHIVTVDVY